MKVIFWLLLSIVILIGSVACFAQPALPDSIIHTNISLPTAAQDFSNGLSALGISVSTGSILKILLGLHILAKMLLKYAIKNPTSLAGKIVKFLAIYHSIPETTTITPVKPS